MTPDDEVQAVLRRSIEAHLAAWSLRNGHLPGALRKLQEAFALRIQAHAMDAARSSRGWRDERLRYYDGIDEALMAFYQRHAQ